MWTTHVVHKNGETPDKNNLEALFQTSEMPT